MNATIVIKTNLTGHPLGASIQVGESVYVFNLHEVEPYSFVKAVQESILPAMIAGPHNGHMVETYNLQTLQALS